MAIKSDQNQPRNLVQGTVSDKNNRKLSGLLVRAFDRDMRSEGLLGECPTDTKGEYRIEYSAEQFNWAEKQTADLCMKVYGAGGRDLLYETEIEQIIFNASPSEEINIVIQTEIKAEENEFDLILREISVLIGGVPAAQLKENRENRDITFLSREAGISAEKLEHLVVAHRLKDESKIDAAFFYALLRKNTLLKIDLTKSLQTRLFIDINAELAPLLYDAALADGKIVQRDVTAAVKETIVPARVGKELNQNLSLLKQYRQRAEEYYRDEHPKKILNILSRFVLEDKVGEIGRLFRENKNDIGTFFKKINDNSFFKNESKASGAKTSLALAELLGFDDAVISQVRQAQKIKTPEDVRRLAALNKADWKKVLTESAGKININGKPLDKKLINFHASALARKMEKEFPSVAFAAQLEREKKPVLQNQDAIRSFLKKHADFDLQTSSIDLFLKEKKLTGEKSDAVRDELKSLQRVFKLVPHYGKTNALLQKNIHSAQSVAAIGETRFVKEVAPGAGISGREAKKIFKKAERINAAAMLVIGELQDTMRALDVPALQMNEVAAKLQAVSKDFPNLKSLFKLTDTCACEHCRSVYSPAAYLVEILQFLDNRSVVDLTIPAPPPPVTRPSVNIAKDVLFERRPDLGDIDLGCENANTPVPYIDLVCELLEEAVAPDAGIGFAGVLSDGADSLKGKISNALLDALTAARIPVTDQAQIFETETTAGSSATLPHYLRDKEAVCKIINNGGNNYTVRRLRQTLAAAEELAAAPAYVNEKAYIELRDNFYAFKLPFDLNLTEARAYFSRFDIARPTLMSDFQVSNVPADEEIAADALGLTDTERNMIATPDAGNQQSFWNTTMADAVTEMKIVDTFLTKSGLTYKELDLLLSLKFINPAANLFIKHLNLTCDTAQKEIANLDAAALDRIHRFLRLQKKTGWKFETLDEIISQPRLGNGKLDAVDDDGDGVTNGNECLIKAAALKKLAEKTGIKLEELLGFYGEIPHAELTNADKKPLYQQIFLNKAKNGFIDPGLLPEKIDGTQSLSNFKTSLSVCLHLSEQDFDKLLPALLNADMTFANLSALYATSSLIRKLKLKVDDFIILTELTGIDIQDSPESTLEFVEAVTAARQFALKPADIKFMLRHEAKNLADREIKDDKIKSVIKKLQADFQKAFIANRSPYDDALNADEQKEMLQNLLSKLRGIVETDVKTFTSLIDGNWIFSWTDETGAVINSTNAAQAIVFLQNRLDKFFDTTSIGIALNALAAVLPLAATANANEAAALTAIDVAQLAVLTAATPVALAAAQAQLTAAVAAEVGTLAAAKAAGANVENKRKDLLKSFLDPVSDFFFKDAKKGALLQTLAASFKTNEELAEIVVDNALLRQPLPGTDLIGDLLQTDALIDKANTPPVLPAVTDAAFPAQYNAIRLLHKLFPLLNSFKLATENVAWHLQNNALLGWFKPDAIPYQAAQNPVDYSTYAAFAETLSLAGQLTPVPNSADAENPLTFYQAVEMLLPGNPTTRAEWIDTFSLLTGYDKADANAIDAYLFPVFSLNDYRDVETWKAVERCVEHLRKLGSTVAQVKEFIKPVLTGVDTDLLRMALKVRYDEEVWLDTLKQITDTVRPQKRDALAAYLLAINPEMKDENDLYDYFLVDVEMESCMPSSRIVQAHGTVQLFVQRCLMGLEPSAAADLNNDKKWEQWKWMRNYRVWEANRKVFLYPENWIEAELRDDKSFLFTELENELLQNELNEFTAEDALIRYLEKLDNIAFLEVVATWYQTDIKTMHVFARTKGGDPAIYYYRRFEQERFWTPWEKVELDITGDHLLAFVRNNRLCLAWLVFSEVPDPNPQSTVPNINSPGATSVDKPKRKLKIQIAVSEFANKKWQQKKVSAQGIETPSNFTDADLPRNRYNLLYFEWGQQIWLFSTRFSHNQEINEVNGIFNIAGCKGYPELAFQGNSFIPDFLPDFQHAVLNTQRYGDLTLTINDNLSVRNGISFFQFLELLSKTPNNFKLTYPLQLTLIDLVSLLLQYLLLHIYGRGNNDRAFKIPLGTLLPYFMEDSHHAYVIIPGFYREDKDPRGKPVYVKRTGSNALQLIEDIIALFTKYLTKYNANPAQDLNALLAGLKADNDYLEIVAEIKIYMGLQYGEQFKNMYHPLVCPLRTTLYKDGIPALMRRETQLQVSPFNFNNNYQPTPAVPLPRPVEDIDFSSDGSYSGYNWELFFHIPFLLATRLTKNQQFEEAMDWFHYMFNPTGALDGDTPQKYWVTKPFFLTEDYVSQRIDTLLYKIANPVTPEIAELEFAIDEWRDKPFQPHVVARFRPVAYQKALLMKYLDNLIEWGDYLFRQDTMESIVQATQMYILADKLLGPKPRIIPPVIKAPYETYNQIEGKLDAFGNALIDLENILPDLSSMPEGGAELPPPPVTLSMLYFCIPQNDKMLDYWDRIADRLFNIRHCRNIEGVERSLALFAPPIDPAMLVRAAASGLDISSVLAGINAPTPFYRFNVLSQKATELVQEVRNLGSSLLQALEKKDAEAMSLLRSELETKVLKAVRDMKLLQIKEAKEQIEILKGTKAVTEERNKYYSNIQKIIPHEQLNLDKLSEAKDWQLAANITYALGAGLALIPDLTLGVSGFGGSPEGAAKFGGSLLAHSTDAIGKGLSIFSAIASYEANRASILGGYDRRFDDWKLQERVAKKELAQIDRQIVAAEIRRDVAETDLKNHDLQIENAKKTDEFMRSKFTNKELYEWTIGQISSVYFRAYQLAYDFAKKAERCYRFELGNNDTFIGFGYWDSLKKGLQSADHLLHDIKRMETGYLDKNKREYEITKHVSLALLDPLALVRLRAAGVCDFEIPEAIYDMDHPGHYFRRVKSVSISLPCIAGPYTSVSAKLSLVSNKYRKNTAKAQGAGTPKEEYEEVAGNDERFTYNVGAIQSIAASNSQNDSGMFELNFRDERYLPFEGCGVVGTWQLELPKEVRQFDYNTISDVVLHVKYTAREGGGGLRGLAESTLKEKLQEIKQQLNQTGLHIALDMKHDLPNEWNLLKTSGMINLTIAKSRLPYFVQSIEGVEIESVTFIAQVKNNPASYSVNIDENAVNLSRIDEWKLCHGKKNGIEIETSFELSVNPAQLSNLEGLMIVVKYSF
ncbi:MAG TPA: neuraminidase-like domain-containing protein [Pyrinomonadaceae bacterium]